MENTQRGAKHFIGTHNFPLDLTCPAEGQKILDPASAVSSNGVRHFTFSFLLKHEEPKSPTLDKKTLSSNDQDSDRVNFWSKNTRALIINPTMLQG